MMNNEKQVNEAMENKVLEAEVVDQKQNVKAKKQGPIKRFAEAHPVAAGLMKAAGLALAGFGLGVLVGSKNNGGSEDYPSEELAYLPSGEDTEI